MPTLLEASPTKGSIHIIHYGSFQTGSDDQATILADGYLEVSYQKSQLISAVVDFSSINSGSCRENLHLVQGEWWQSYPWSYCHIMLIIFVLAAYLMPLIFYKFIRAARDGKIKHHCWTRECSIVRQRSSPKTATIWMFNTSRENYGCNFYRAPG